MKVDEGPVGAENPQEEPRTLVSVIWYPGLIASDVVHRCLELQNTSSIILSQSNLTPEIRDKSARCGGPLLPWKAETVHDLVVFRPEPVVRQGIHESMAATTRCVYDQIPVHAVNMVRMEGLEPSRHCWHRPLKPARLPVPPHPQNQKNGLIQLMRPIVTIISSPRYPQ